MWPTVTLKVIICSPDTDVFLLLIHHYQSLSAETHFLTGSGDRKRIISVRDAFECLPNHRQCLLGFHAFTGCDMTSKFASKTKFTCWCALMKADQCIKMLRSHLVTSIWKDANKAKTREPEPVDYGWYSTEEGELMPITTDETPVPESVVELCVYSCSKSRCVTNMCTCHSNGMGCTDMCQCIGSTNNNDDRD